MAEPGNEIGGPSQLRASDAEREHVIDLLKAAFVQGRLAMDEFDLRVGSALTSRTSAELADLTADIPAGLTGAQPRLPARDSGNKASAAVMASLALLFGMQVAVSFWVGADGPAQGSLAVVIVVIATLLLQVSIISLANRRKA